MRMLPSDRQEYQRCAVWGSVFLISSLLIFGGVYSRYHYRFDAAPPVFSDSPFVQDQDTANRYDDKGRLTRSGIYEQDLSGHQVLRGYYHYSYRLTAEQKENGVIRTAVLKDLNGLQYAVADYYSDAVLLEYHDEKGVPTRLMTYDAKLQTLQERQDYFYDENGVLTQIVYRDGQLQVSSRMCYEYNADRTLSTCTVYDGSGVEISSEAYFYNEGNCTLKRIYGRGHMAISYITLAYRADGALLQEGHYRADSTLLFTLKYLFDENGTPTGESRKYDAAGQPMGWVEEPQPETESSQQQSSSQTQSAQ